MDQVRTLRVFARVASEGSFAGAARSLDMAPAVVTRAIAELEAYLGARLLHRTTRSLALTDVGATYLEQALRVLADLKDADLQAGAAATQASGTLRILCPPAFAVHQLAPLLPRLRVVLPRVSMELVARGPVDMADEDYDVLIVSVPQSTLQGDFVARQLASSNFLLCAAPSYLAQRGRPQHPDELPAHDGLLPAVSAVRRELTLFRDGRSENTDAAHVVRMPTPHAVLSTGHIDILLAAAVAGLGIAGLPSFASAQAMREGSLERVLPQWRGSRLFLYAAIPSRQHVPARTRAFVDLLVQAFGGTDADPWLTAQPRPDI